MIRNVHVFAILIVLIALPLAADVRFGPMTIVHWPNLVGAESETTRSESERRFAAGVVFETDLGSRFQLVLEPALLEKGARYVEREGTPLRSTVRLQYAELPVLLRRSFGTRQVRPYAAAGPSVAWLRSASVETSIDGGAEEVDLTSDLPRFEAALVAAVGFTVDFGVGRFFAQGEFAQGLTNLDSTAETSWTNQGVAIRTGVTVSLGRH